MAEHDLPRRSGCRVRAAQGHRHPGETRRSSPRDPNEGKPIVPVVLCGPTGVGRKTIYRALDEEFPDRFAYVCSKTTRAAKEGEQAGVHYEYVDRASFESEIADGKFVEYAEIDGELFGTPVEAVQAAHDANKVPVIVVDVQGVTRLREVYPQGAFCLVTPSSVDGLESRIRKIKETPPPPEGEDAAVAEGDAEGGDEDEVKLPDEPPELTDEQKEEIAERLDKISRQMTGCDADGLFTDVIASLDDAPELAYGDLKTAIARVHPKLLVPPPKPLVISGPLGSRKEEVFEALLKEFPDSFGFPLATTTREPEPGEIDGVHHRFVDEATFDAEAEEGKFLECTEVIVGYGEWVDEDVGNPPITVRYGTPFAEVKRLSVEGKMPVLETDAAGAAAMRAAGLDALFVFFAHPTHDAREHERNLADVGEEPDAFPERIAEAGRTRPPRTRLSNAPRTERPARSQASVRLRPGVRTPTARGTRGSRRRSRWPPPRLSRCERFGATVARDGIPPLASTGTCPRASPSSAPPRRARAPSRRGSRRRWTCPTSTRAPCSGTPRTTIPRSWASRRSGTSTRPRRCPTIS